MKKGKFFFIIVGDGALDVPLLRFIVVFILLAFSFGEGGPLAVEEVGNEISISLKT